VTFDNRPIITLFIYFQGVKALIKVLSLLLALTLCVVSSAQQVMKPLPVDQKSGRQLKPNWLSMNWKDVKMDGKLKVVRVEVDRIPARVKQTRTLDISSKILAARKRFFATNTFQDFYRWLYLCARFPKSGRAYGLELDRFLSEFQSPDCFEYSRAAFIYFAVTRGNTEISLSRMVPRFKSLCDNDWLLKEALIRFQIDEGKSDFAACKWCWATAKDLVDSMPEGRYGFGTLRLDSAFSLMLINKDVSFIDQEISFADNLIKSGLFTDRRLGHIRLAREMFVKFRSRLKSSSAQSPMFKDCFAESRDYKSHEKCLVIRAVSDQSLLSGD